MRIQKIHPITQINFYGKIIDSHMHTGHWTENGQRYDYTSEIDRFIKSPLENGDEIEKVIVSNLDCIEHKSKTEKGIEFFHNEIDGNKALLALAEKNKQIVPLITCQPGYGNAENIEKLINENPNKFGGFKFHPEQLELAANSESYYPYMELAQKYKLPCLFHSHRSFDVDYGNGNINKACKFSRPSQVYELAKKYPDVNVVLAHWGGDGEKNIDEVTKYIIESVKTNNSKLYADISWVDCETQAKPNIKRIISELKKENALDRILFGTDAPLGRFGRNGANGISPEKHYSNYVNDIKAMIKKEFPEEADSIIDRLFHDNAENLFIKHLDSNVPTAGDKSLKIIWGTAIIGGLITAGIINFFISKTKKTPVKPLPSEI